MASTIQIFACHPFQVIERINSRRMPVGPNRLNRITAHANDADQFKSFRGQGLFRISVNVPHDVHLALATRARTTSPQFLQRNETFAAVIPLDGQFVADLLNVHRSHQFFFNQRSNTTRVSGLTWCSMPSASISAAFSGTPSERKKATTVSCRRLHSPASRCPAFVRKMAR